MYTTKQRINLGKIQNQYENLLVDFMERDDESCNENDKFVEILNEKLKWHSKLIKALPEIDLNDIPFLYSDSESDMLFLIKDLQDFESEKETLETILEVKNDMTIVPLNKDFTIK